MRHLHGDAHKGRIRLHLTSSDYVFLLLGTLASRCVLFFLLMLFIPTGDMESQSSYNSQFYDG